MIKKKRKEENNNNKPSSREKLRDPNAHAKVLEKCFPMPLERKENCDVQSAPAPERWKKNADDCLLACTLLDEQKKKQSRSIWGKYSSPFRPGNTAREE